MALFPAVQEKKGASFPEPILVQESAGLVALSGSLAYFDNQHDGCVGLAWQGRSQAYTSATAEHQGAQQSAELQTQTQG